MMLIPFVTLSQEDSTSVSLSFLQHVESDLRELERKRAESKLNNLIIAKYKSAAEKYQSAFQESQNEVSSWKRSFLLMENLYQVEQISKPKSNWFLWALGAIGAFFTGYFVGAVF